jgi:hypothetical protein
MGDKFILAEDKALKAYLQGITVTDDKNAARLVKVWYGYPDVEVRDQSFPFITIDLIDVVPANERQTSGVLYDSDYIGTVAVDGTTLYSYDTPVAYDLVYQVTSYSRHPRHDRELMFRLHHKFPSKYGSLEVPNELGTASASRSMFLDGFTKRDAVEGETGNRRLLRNVYSVRVISQMTPLVAAQVSVAVEDVLLNTNTSFIPPEYYPVQ